MRVARIVCAVSLYVELYDASQPADTRLGTEANTRLAKAAEANEAASKGADVGALNPDVVFGDDRPLKFGSFVIRQVIPIKWRLLRNSFRHADEFECTIPASLLPFPPSTVRAISCVVEIQHVDSVSWASGMVDSARGTAGNLASQPAVGSGDEYASFLGVCHRIQSSVSVDKIPGTTLHFRDFVGLLVSKKIRANASFDEDLPISESVAKFLVGSPAEGMTVVWVDPATEPSLGKYRPALMKKKGKSKKAAPPKENYLDAIERTCSALGVVPRVVGPRLELAYAGTMYSGEDRGGDLAATMLVGNVVEDLDTEHVLIGLDTKAVQVIAFDPDTHQQHTARWPADPSAAKTKTLGPNETSHLKPVAANVGLPGFEQLDESVLLIEVAPVSNPELLPKVAQAIFLERTRQRIKIKIKTHSPWSDPSSADQSTGDLLDLQAGDNVKLAVGLSDNGQAAQDVRALLGELGIENTRALLTNTGVPEDTADKIARAVETIPRTDLLRVDTVEITGGDTDPEIKLTLVNFTVIISDLERKAGGANVDEITSNLRRDSFLIGSLAPDDAKAVYQDARRLVRDQDLDPAAEAKALTEIDNLERETLKNQ